MTESVTGFTAERMLAIENAAVISGSVVGDNLHLQTKGGADIDAGSVRGPEGPVGPPSLGIDAWPVGSIFMSVVDTNPNTLLGGGTWARIAQGKVLVGVDENDTSFDTVEETGGEKTHVLTSAEMPSHTHTQNSHNHNDTLAVDNAGGHDHAIEYRVRGVAAGTYDFAEINSTTPGNPTSRGVVSTDGTHAHNVSGGVSSATAVNQNTGGGTAHNNLQPYLTCYIWKRTA